MLTEAQQTEMQQRATDELLRRSQARGYFFAVALLMEAEERRPGSCAPALEILKANSPRAFPIIGAAG